MGGQVNVENAGSKDAIDNRYLYDAVIIYVFCRSMLFYALRQW
jgi:hypothetical protein